MFYQFPLTQMKKIPAFPLFQVFPSIETTISGIGVINLCLQDTESSQ